MRMLYLTLEVLSTLKEKWYKKHILNFRFFSIILTILLKLSTTFTLNCGSMFTLHGSSLRRHEKGWI